MSDAAESVSQKPGYRPEKPKAANDDIFETHPEYAELQDWIKKDLMRGMLLWGACTSLGMLGLALIFA